MNVFNKSSKLAVDFTQSKGFTLIELLVVMAILGILAVVGLSSFRTSLAKSRDAKRKSDLEQVQRALEMYYNDYGKYPATLTTWGGIFSSNGTDTGTIYMKELPKDPSGSLQYCYKYSATSVSYQLYAKLENMQDPACIGGQTKCATPLRTCGGNAYNYGISSSNTTP